MTWDFLINPMISALALFYQVFGNNIVLAIAAITVIIRLLTSPIMLQQQRSATEMQKLQPELRRLQEKYKGDREKLQLATMEVYRKHGVNPVAGCLPLFSVFFIQMPILFALYATISHALSSTPYQVVDMADRMPANLEALMPLNKIWLGMDLTQIPTIEAAVAPWALTLPILVLATTWLQSKLTIPAPTPSPDGKPNPAESMTRSMTTIMPIMFGFFALSFPIGMSIYFIVGNIVGIIQYSMMGKANWRGLFGMTPLEKPAPPSTVIIDDDDEEAYGVGATPVAAHANGRSSSASKDILKTKPTSNAGKGGNVRYVKPKKKRK